MSDFIFNCSNCQQPIQTPSEYVGQQITCPGCQTALIVPADPNAPPPPPVKAGTRLSKDPTAGAAAPSTALKEASAGATANLNRIVKKKKSKTGLIVGISCGAAAFIAVIVFWPQIRDFANKKPETVAVQSADTNTAPPPPPELTTEEIFAKCAEAYAALSDFTARGVGNCELDLSGGKPNAQIVRSTTFSTLQLARSNYYRIDWSQNGTGKEVKGAIWNSGKGDYAAPGVKLKTRDMAMALPMASFVWSPIIAEIFFSATNSAVEDAKEFAKTNAPDINNSECYTLVGQANHESIILWIRKDNFLVNRLMVRLGGNIDDAELKKMPSSQQAQMKMLMKLRGTITEDYDQFQTNRHLMAASFETPYKAPSAATAGNANANPNAPRKFGSMAEKLTHPRRPGSGGVPPPQ
jgi:hypothetical protein